MKNKNLQNPGRLDYAGKRELRNSEIGLLNYNKNIILKMQNYFKTSPNDKKQVLEFGAGNGALAQIWKKEHGINPICIEIDPILIVSLENSGFKSFKNIDELGTVEFIYSSNVLEHIKDDVDALRTLRKHLPIDGKLSLYVPALPILFSDFDVQVGHYRRYTRKELIRKVESAGFQIDACFYQDSIGILVGILLKIIGYKQDSNLGSQATLTIYDRLIFPVSLFLDKILFKKLAGKNLFLFATAK
jgi:hypothetical protein